MCELNLALVHVIGRGGVAIWSRLRQTMEAVAETRHVLSHVRALIVDSAPWSGDFWSMLRHHTLHASALRSPSLEFHLDFFE